jgi:hypothetical protein
VEAVGTARLTNDILAQRAVGASVSRNQIADVLQELDGDPELVLDLVAEEGGEHATISMAWSRDDLEQLLAGAGSSGDEVMLMFDRDELTNALGDVEAHGVRTTAAVFAVAAASALGSGAAVNAAVTGGGGGGIAATPVVSTSTADASTAATLARSEALNAEYGLGDAGASAAATEARSEALNAEYGLGDPGASAAATDARSQALNAEYGLGDAGASAAATEARSQALNAEYGLGDAGASAAATEARSQALNQEYGLGDAGAARATELRSQALNQEYGLGGAGDATAATATGDSSDGGLTLQRATVDDALLIGGLLVTIAGATFVVRRSATGRPA